MRLKFEKNVMWYC